MCPIKVEDLGRLSKKKVGQILPLKVTYPNDLGTEE